jgi:hypothetical protein
LPIDYPVAWYLEVVCVLGVLFGEDCVSDGYRVQGWHFIGNLVSTETVCNELLLRPTCSTNHPGESPYSRRPQKHPRTSIFGVFENLPSRLPNLATRARGPRWEIAGDIINIDVRSNGTNLSS